MRITISKEFWHKHIKAWQQSSLSQSEYCKEHGISIKSFSRWKIKLTTPPKQGALEQSGIESPLTLVPVEIIKSEEHAEIDAGATLHSPGGWQVKLNSISATELGQLLGRLP